MKTKLLSLLAIGALLVGCTSKNSDGNGNGDANSTSLNLRNYSFTETQRLKDADSTATLNPYIQLTGYGVVPMTINGKDVTELRDSLLTIAEIKANPDGTYSYGEDEDLAPLAKDVKVDEPSSWVRSLVSVKNITPKVIVFQSYAEAYYAGAAHGSHNVAYLNYCLEHGKILSLSDIFKPGYEEKLTEVLRSNLSENPEVISANEAKIPDQFYLTPDGITFVWQVYEIAPYSAGDIEETIYPNDLTDLLTPQGAALFIE